ncbi:hypothetical protein LJB96_04890 [Methanobrevibacter sp. OttesenSCG-928-K11]|nr:hypothetical protein [Methanobrevibacter sp. OttesenSCG-928-K11]MDL2271218.1 hypothetical protein [Methanobrevibacter sp. OttesenSCG-928-I08]
MALTMRPEKGVKLTKQDKHKLEKKISKGWKSTILLPDYKIGEDGSLTTATDKTRRSIKIIKILDDSIMIEKAINRKKNIRISWGRIALIQKSRDLKDGLEITIVDGTKIEFTVYNSFKINQIMDFIINYVNQKKLEENSNISMHN